MATVTEENKPFVQWKFKCSTPEEKKAAKKRAKELLSYYLEGIANGVQLSNPFYPKISFEVVEESFTKDAAKNDIYIYQANLQRNSANGALFQAGDSVKIPPEPKRPKL